MLPAAALGFIEPQPAPFIGPNGPEFGPPSCPRIGLLGRPYARPPGPMAPPPHKPPPPANPESAPPAKPVRPPRTKPPNGLPNAAPANKPPPAPSKPSVATCERID